MQSIGRKLKKFKETCKRNKNGLKENLGLSKHEAYLITGILLVYNFIKLNQESYTTVGSVITVEYMNSSNFSDSNVLKNESFISFPFNLN